MELDELLAVLAAFEREGVEYVLIGGAALNIHGILRATEDADVFLRPSEDNIARLRRALDSVYCDPLVAEIRAEDLLGQYPAVRYGPPTGSLLFDFLTRLGDAFRWEDLEWEVVDVFGVPVRVATPKTLYRMKHATLRPQDRADAERLQAEFGFEEP